jgi:large-conductance mechanosensitive channel
MAKNNLKKKFITGTWINRFRNFLIEKDLIYFMIAVYAGTVLQRFLESLTNSIILPIIGIITPSWVSENENNLQDYLEDLGFVDIRNFLIQTFNLLLAIFISYALIRFVLRLNNGN